MRPCVIGAKKTYCLLYTSSSKSSAPPRQRNTPSRPSPASAARGSPIQPIRLRFSTHPTSLRARRRKLALSYPSSCVQTNDIATFLIQDMHPIGIDDDFNSDISARRSGLDAYLRSGRMCPASNSFGSFGPSAAESIRNRRYRCGPPSSSGRSERQQQIPGRHDGLDARRAGRPHGSRPPVD